MQNKTLKQIVEKHAKRLNQKPENIPKTPYEKRWCAEDHKMAKELGIKVEDFR